MEEFVVSTFGVDWDATICVDRMLNPDETAATFPAIFLRRRS
jgi:hypothetical protein